MRVLVSCANGSGTSLMLQKSAQKALEELGFKVTAINHTSIAEGKSTAKNYDVVFTPLNFVNMFDQAAKSGVTVIGVQNVMSAKEVKQRIEESDLKPE
ncbi:MULTISPECIES: PTS sugar transporter subunit IIB [Aerococcus]|uniref:PTS ascorbate transporter subunit IIB n=1 Tax=Aerococcus urinae TaxID=1376 RepID=A0A2I1L686_9LACT|nr:MULTISPECIES: PTS sugar transporter subunit IIB [Aerococcus]KAA9219198.1 PTS sugar transporter subunit IIB [Aerococcus loyolae]KAA9266669.1 PTS sugar transporter subunit IIB [Aerococcus loyolae]KAA9297496.1 PTS sugar transporter subunit IIB [Aerococcus tenax]MCY3067783.1 PTS sugar transporter subunit IIB [Aerococcus mictus]MCY3080317.1 PTS sugar transporter subunit IIB [Aerococcus mictus]